MANSVDPDLSARMHSPIWMQMAYGYSWLSDIVAIAFQLYCCVSTLSRVDRRFQHIYCIRYQPGLADPCVKNGMKDQQPRVSNLRNNLQILLDTCKPLLPFVIS